METSEHTDSPRPDPAELARTLASGVVLGVLRIPPASWTANGGSEGGDDTAAVRFIRTFPVQQLTDPSGQLLLLLADNSPAHRYFQSRAAQELLVEAPAVLDVLDVPPGQLSLPRARLCVIGWAEPIPPETQMAVAGAVAAVRPLETLLDVGAGRTLYRIDVAEIRLTTATAVHVVTPEEFAAAAPDPLYHEEDDVVAHLETYHRDVITRYAYLGLPSEAAAQLREVSVASLDRYGLDLLCAIGAVYQIVRAAFSTPVDTLDELPDRLAELFQCPCSTGPCPTTRPGTSLPHVS